MAGTLIHLFSNQHSYGPRMGDPISRSKIMRHESRNIFGILLLAFKSQRIKIETTLREMVFTFWVKLMSE